MARGSAPRTPAKRSTQTRLLQGRRELVNVDADFTAEYPGADPTSTEISAALMIVGGAVDAEFGRLIDHAVGVPHTTFNALAVIDGAGEPITPTTVSERMTISTATMTSILDTLEGQGWIRRVPNPDDRRSVLLEITDAGRAVSDRVLPAIHLFERTFCDPLTDAERRQLLRLLGKIMPRLNELAATEPAVSGKRVRPGRLR